MPSFFFQKVEALFLNQEVEPQFFEVKIVSHDHWRIYQHMCMAEYDFE